MVTLAQRLEALRTEKGLTRPALSVALGMPRNAVEKFETGRQTPTKEQQNKIAAYFGVSLAYLQGESDDPTSMASWIQTALSGVAMVNQIQFLLQMLMLGTGSAIGVLGAQYWGKKELLPIDRKSVV